MLDFLFGWRKASKCKKLIRRVQCRLKLLHSKRCCIVKQLRQDVAELLRHGHHQTAFDRVEQVFKDETLVKIYDLLAHFCEFIVINLPYIRKHKDCPNDINEAASTLIFSSARFGELPELLSIRKLFEERYGHRFVMAALQLLPGHLVHTQIIESLCIKDVPDDEKYRLLDEIGSSTCYETGPLFLEYKPFWQEEHVFVSTEPEISKIVPVDLSSEIKKIPKDYNLKHEEAKEMVSVQESSSEKSVRLPDQEMIYFDDIEEIVSPGINLEDQRLFVFKSCCKPFKKDEENRLEERGRISGDENWISRSSRKAAGRPSRKRTRRRRRSLSLENVRGTNDIECAMYYEGSNETSPDHHDKHKSYTQRQPRNKSSVEEIRESYGELVERNQKHDDFLKKGDIVDKCSLDHPCYDFCVKNEKNAHCWIPKMKSSKIVHSLVENKMQCGIEFDKDSCGGEEEGNGAGDEERRAPNFSRAMTMITERPNENGSVDNIIRSKSFPIEQPRSLHPSCRHIHPKLPDYDELAEKFMALKRENLQNKQHEAVYDQKF